MKACDDSMNSSWLDKACCDGARNCVEGNLSMTCRIFIQIVLLPVRHFRCMIRQRYRCRTISSSRVIVLARIRYTLNIVERYTY